MVEMRKMCIHFMLVEFDPNSQMQASLLSLLLTLSIMGGYGRADKYISTPKPMDDISNLHPDIEETTFINVLKRSHDVAFESGYQPMNSNERERPVMGCYKLTGASEKIKISITKKEYFAPDDVPDLPSKAETVSGLGDVIATIKHIPLLIYAPPGSGKTTWHKDRIYDTDCLTNWVKGVTPNVVITNDPSLVRISGKAYFMIPTKKVFRERCISKCGDRYRENWFKGVLGWSRRKNVKLIESDEYMSDTPFFKNLSRDWWGDISMKTNRHTCIRTYRSFD